MKKSAIIMGVLLCLITAPNLSAQVEYDVEVIFTPTPAYYDWEDTLPENYKPQTYNISFAITQARVIKFEDKTYDLTWEAIKINGAADFEYAQTKDGPEDIEHPGNILLDMNITFSPGTFNPVTGYATIDNVFFALPLTYSGDKDLGPRQGDSFAINIVNFDNPVVATVYWSGNITKEAAALADISGSVTGDIGVNPEPATMLSFLAGLAAFAAKGLRRRKQKT